MGAGPAAVVARGEPGCSLRVVVCAVVVDVGQDDLGGPLRFAFVPTLRSVNHSVVHLAGRGHPNPY